MGDQVYDGSPVAALRRIAFLLERGRADSYKVKAYRGAANAILPLPAGEVAERVRAGTLTQLAGVGASTARVIAQAVEGRVPDKLAEVEAEYGAPLTADGAGSALRARLRGDLHSHLGLVRRRLAHRGDGDDGDGARARLPRADRPLAAPEGGPRALRRAAGPPTRRGRRRQRAPRRRVPAVRRGSRSTSSTTAGSTRPRGCWPGSTSAWRASTRAARWTPSR